MNNRIEEEIVKMFVKKNKQARLIWEFRDPQKRQSIMIRKFASPGIFEDSCIQPAVYMPPNMLESCLFKLSKAEEVYYIGESYIGESSLHEAALRANTGEMCIIYCGKGIGYYQGEQEQGRPPRYLLQKSN